MLVLGAGVATVANEAARLVPQVLVADRPELEFYDPELWSAAVAQVAREGEASSVLIAGTRSGREYSPRVAVKLGGALLEDVISLTREDGETRAMHYVYLARVAETIATEAPLVVASIKPGAFAASPALPQAGEQFDVELELPAPRVRVTARTSERASRIALQEADIVVTGGRGVGSVEGFSRYVEALADWLGAAVGATRAIVDAGWRPYSEQVGQTGKTVQPKAYIALGVSGAVQHLSGMNKSKFIIAINKDANSPIFQIADLAVVGDVAALVPAIFEELSK